MSSLVADESKCACLVQPPVLPQPVEQNARQLAEEQTVNHLHHSLKGHGDHARLALATQARVRTAAGVTPRG